MSHDAGALIGRWMTDPQDLESILEYGLVSLEFAADGNLRYIAHVEGKDQIMDLTYRVEDGMLITNQPSEPREERTPFALTPEGRLVLTYGDVRSYYVRNSAVRL